MFPFSEKLILAQFKTKFVTAHKTLHENRTYRLLPNQNDNDIFAKKFWLELRVGSRTPSTPRPPHPRRISLDLVNNKTTQNSVDSSIFILYFFSISFFFSGSMRRSSLFSFLPSQMACELHVCECILCGIVKYVWSSFGRAVCLGWFEYRHPRAQSVSQSLG